MMRGSRLIFAGALLLASSFLVASCRDDGPTTPVTRGRVTLDQVWPYADGLGWTYHAEHRVLPGGPPHFYATVAEVPDAPDMDDIVARLGVPYAGAVVSSDTSTYVLRFAGLITTGSGVTRPNLTETVITPSGPVTIGGADLLAQVLRARPDLRLRLASRAATLAPADTFHAAAAILLHGYAWEKTRDWIGTYGDVDQLLAWKYLTSNLAPGSEFTHRLVPSLATDVFLHGRILSRRTVTTRAGSFVNAVVCAYLIDYGIATGADTEGNSLGYTRSYGYGSVTYVAGVGPVACYERQLVPAGGDEIGAGEITLDLVSHGSEAPLLAALPR